MAKVSRLEVKFKDVIPYRVVGRDVISVASKRLRLSPITIKRMGYPETLRVQVSEDRRAIQLSVPGPFAVTQVQESNKREARFYVNSIMIAKEAMMGSYVHAGENLFIHE